MGAPFRVGAAGSSGWEKPAARPVRRDLHGKILAQFPAGRKHPDNVSFIVNAVEKKHTLLFNRQAYGPPGRKAPVRFL